MSDYSKSQEYVRTRKLWSGEEDDLIRGDEKLSIPELCERLNRSYPSVAARCSILGVSKRKLPKQASRMSPHGYTLIECSERGAYSKKRLEHRVVMEGIIGRPLTDKEEVHHINHVRTDNRVENLYLCEDKVAHVKVHTSMIPIIRELLERGTIMFNKTEGRYEIV
jgi:hypothetical protein